VIGRAFDLYAYIYTQFDTDSINTNVRSKPQRTSCALETAQSAAMDEKAKQPERNLKVLPVYILQYFIASAVSVTVLYGGYYYCDSIPIPRSDDFSEKLLYAARYCTFPQAVFLLVAIWMVIAKRAYAGAVDPLAGREHLVQTEKNILANTLEQLLVFLLLIVTLTTYLEPLEMRIIPLYSLTFIVGRVLFTIGYSIKPRYRSLGVVTNLSSSSFFVGYVIYLMYLRGFMYGSLLSTDLSNPTVIAGTEKVEL
jgi:hypothetical protein